MTGKSSDLGERVSALETDMERLMGNGQPGVIARLEERLARLENLKWIAGGAILAAAFLSGSGTFTLDHVLKAFGH